ncbi:hypothetical protein ACSZMW_09805 [Aeromonas allosaccharophila]
MEYLKQPIDMIEIIKSIGPYAVALGTTAFGYLQTKRVTEITKEKDIELANLQQVSIRNSEKLKNHNAALIQLQRTLSPIYAKAEVVLHNYIGLVVKNTSAKNLECNLAKFVLDDYTSFSVESRKIALAEAIAICQILQDQNAYELIVKFESAITKALGLINFAGDFAGPEHLNEVIEARNQYSLLYVSIFYRLSSADT